MKIKKGDKVIVVAGKDKGIVGEVIAAFPRVNKVVVKALILLKSMKNQMLQTKMEASYQKKCQSMYLM